MRSRDGAGPAHDHARWICGCVEMRAEQPAVPRPVVLGVRGRMDADEAAAVRMKRSKACSGPG